MNGKYVLSKKYAIRFPTKDEKEMAPEVFNKHYVLVHKFDDSEYVISGEIRNFLRNFTKPNTLNNVIKQYHQQYKLPVKSVTNIVTPFLEQLQEYNIIVTKEYNKKSYSTIATYLQPGEIIEGFIVNKAITLEKNIQVYTVKDANNNIKILKLTKLTAKEHYLNRLRQEYSILTTFKTNPYTITAISHFKNSTYEGIFINFFNGIPISDFIETKFKTLTVVNKITMGAKILKAYHYLHTNGIIQGDIHLSNILVNKQREIRLIDFGLAHFTNRKKNLYIKVGGANFFMPPERIKADSFDKYSKDPDLFSDVYQLGLILYSLFYNSVPYEDVVWDKLSTKIKNGQLTFPKTTSKPEIMNEVKKILTKALDKNPAKRYRSAIPFYNAWNKIAQQL
jgi:serine/threonine protein kinase